MDELSSTLALLFLTCLVPSTFFLIYFTSRDRFEPEPPGYILFAFALGTVSAPLALFLFGALEQHPFYQGLTRIDTQAPLEQFLTSMMVIGPVEEMAKFVPLFIWLKIFKVVDEPMDGLVYAAAAALGFATIENWHYMLSLEEMVWSRAITLPFNHVLFSSFWGYGLGLAWTNRGRSKQGSRYLLMGLFLAISFHGLYDYVLLNTEIPDLAVLPLVFLLWLWVSLVTRRADRDSPFRPDSSS